MDVYALYRDLGGIREGHFLLSSGMHSPLFFQSAAVMQHPKVARKLAAALAEQVAGWPVDFVIGPAIGGVLLSSYLAEQLGVRGIFAEKSADPERMRIRPGLIVQPGEHFLAVEDVLTTGGSVGRAIRAAEAMGGRCSGLAAIIDRSGGNTLPAAPLAALLTLTVPRYPPATCPICDQGLPLQEI